MVTPLPAFEPPSDKVEAGWTDVARAIGDELVTEASERDHDTMTWGRDRTMTGAVAADSGPYQGRCGEALFLSALASASGDGRYEAAARLAMSNLCKTANCPVERARLTETVGVGLTGIGGMIVALLHVARHLEDDSYCDAALQLGASLTPVALDAAQSIDVYGGLAGALLGLVALHRAVSGSFTGIHACAQKIIERREASPAGYPGAWRSAAGIAEGGTAHGASGIAYALLQASQLTNDAAAYDGAIQGYSFEDHLFCESIGDWLDTPDQPPGKARASWCHGAAGIGLTRLHSLDILAPQARPFAMRDLERALSRMMHRSLPGGQSLCCGSSGRIDFLLEAARLLARRELATCASAQAGQLRDQMIRRSGGRRQQSSQRPSAAGLWQGITGVGYTMLRMTDTERFPTILLLS